MSERPCTSLDFQPANAQPGRHELASALRVDEKLWQKPDDSCDVLGLRNCVRRTKANFELRASFTELTRNVFGKGPGYAVVVPRFGVFLSQLAPAIPSCTGTVKNLR